MGQNMTSSVNVFIYVSFFLVRIHEYGIGSKKKSFHLGHNGTDLKFQEQDIKRTSATFNMDSTSTSNVQRRFMESSGKEQIILPAVIC